MNAVLHAADVSNPYKPFKLYKPWAINVINEFWN